MFKGVITALITPFRMGQLDILSLEKLIFSQVKAKVDGILLAGTTGEHLSLTQHEYKLLIERAIEIASDDISIIVNIKGHSTSEVVAQVHELNNLKIWGIMCTVPAYYKPSQHGIYKHFCEVSKYSKHPIMFYLHPKRTGSDLEDSTIVKIAELDNILSLKDASLDSEKPLRLLDRIRKTKKEFTILSGDDVKALSYYANGGDGIVSVASNVFPGLMKALDESCSRGDYKSALLLQKKIFHFCNALTVESNPVGIKFAACLQDLCSTYDVRLPLVRIQEENKKIISDRIKYSTNGKI